MSLNNLEHALRVPVVWDAAETGLLLEAFIDAHEKRGRGMRESLFAAAAALLRARQKDAGIYGRMESRRQQIIANRRETPRAVTHEDCGDAMHAVSDKEER